MPAGCWPVQPTNTWHAAMRRAGEIVLPFSMPLSHHSLTWSTVRQCYPQKRNANQQQQSLVDEARNKNRDDRHLDKDNANGTCSNDGASLVSQTGDDDYDCWQQLMVRRIFPGKSECEWPPNQRINHFIASHSQPSISEIQFVERTWCHWSSMEPCDEKYPVSWISCNSLNMFPLGNISMVTEIAFLLLIIEYKMLYSSFTSTHALEFTCNYTFLFHTWIVASSERILSPRAHVFRYLLLLLLLYFYV